MVLKRLVIAVVVGVTACVMVGLVPASQVAFYLQNVHIEPRKIYLSLLAENADSGVGE